MAIPLFPHEADRVVLGFLPGDVDGNRLVSGQDIIALIDSLNGVTPRAMESTDINRNRGTTPTDILRLVDLFNGANTTRAWLGAALPPKPK